MQDQPLVVDIVDIRYFVVARNRTRNVVHIYNRFDMAYDRCRSLIMTARMVDSDMEQSHRLMH